MGFDTLRFTREYHIPTLRGSHKRVRAGWVQIQRCPFCGGNDGHLGIHTKSGVANCWRCGGHSRIEVIMHLCSVNKQEARKILKDYQTDEFLSAWEERVRAKWVNLPAHRKTMPDAHYFYLQDRGFDPEELEAVWDIRCVGFAGYMKNRILIPIYYREKLISFTARSILGPERLEEENEPKYRSCPSDQEVIPHKSIVYGIDLCFHNKVVIVEGPADVWKLGPGAVATFGTDFTEAQVRLLATRFTEAAILYDTEKMAQSQAKKLATALSALGVEAEIAQLQNGDPGALSYGQGENVMRQLLFSS